VVKVGIIGATGYTGAELVRLLSAHPGVELVALTSQSYVGQSIDEIYPNLPPVGLVCIEQDISHVVDRCDVVFIALPHGHAVPVAAAVLAAGKKVIDLGADFRFRRAETYEQWYGHTHEAPELCTGAVYGLPEVHREAIRGANLVANPGCYPTSAILALAPALRAGLIDPATIIIDSKSGVSGAGRGLNLGSLYAEVNESVHPYNIGQHRHTPEIEQELSGLAGQPVTVSFTPHLMPMTRGILSTVYASLAVEADDDTVRRVYTHFFSRERFIRLLPPKQWPRTKWASGSNNCFLNFTVDRRTNRLVVAAAIDNLIKGASGQAVQNMNLMCGFAEDTALAQPGQYP